MKHTPTPWTADESVPSDGFECFWLQGNDGRLIGSINGPQSGISADDAFFIVRACNAHDALIAALREAQEFVGGCIDGEGWDLESNGTDWPEELLSQLAAALAKAEGR